MMIHGMAAWEYFFSLRDVTQLPVSFEKMGSGVFQSHTTGHPNHTVTAIFL